MFALQLVLLAQLARPAQALVKTCAEEIMLPANSGEHEEKLANSFSFNGGDERPSFVRDPQTGLTTIEWQRVYDAVGAHLRARGVPLAGPLYSHLVIKGERAILLGPGVTQYSLKLDPTRQADFYIELFNPVSGSNNAAPSDLVHRTKVGLAENFTSRLITPQSFRAIEQTAVQMPGWFQSKYAFTSELTTYAVNLSQKKVVFIPKPAARSILDALPPGWQIQVNFDDDYKISSVAAIGSDGAVLHTFGPNALYIKGDAAFNDNSFFWDDMFWAMSTSYRFRALAESTVDFWYDVSEIHSKKTLGPFGGFVPREVRSNLTSFHYVWDPIHGLIRYNTELVNPNLASQVEWELYSLGEPTEARDRLPRAIEALKGEIEWKDKHRATTDKNGQIVPGGYWTSNLASGMDNQPRVGGIENESNYHNGAWIDMLAQQILSYRDMARMQAALGQWSDAEASRSKALDLAEIMNRDFWSEEDGLYLDRIPDANGNLVLDRKNPSIATFWALLTGLVPPEHFDTFLKKQMTKNQFGGGFPFPSLPRSHPLFEASGGYWLGAHWPNMMTVATQALEANGRSDLATHYMAEILGRMTEASEPYHAQTGKWTVYENYGEQKDSSGYERGIPGRKDSDNYVARKDFAGWGLVPPLLGMLKYEIGFRPVPGFSGSDVDYQRWLKFLQSDVLFKNTNFLSKAAELFPRLLSDPKVRQGYMELNLRVDPRGETMDASGINYQGYNRIHQLEVRKVSDAEFEVTVTSDKPFNLQVNRLYDLNPENPLLGNIQAVGGGGTPQTYRFQVR